MGKNTFMNDSHAIQSLSELPTTMLTGVGAKVAERLEKLGVRSVYDLLFHLPRRYQDRTRVYPLASVRVGEYVTVQGSITEVNMTFRRKGRQLAVRIEDSTGTLTLRFFHFTREQQSQFVKGASIRCFGEVRFGQKGRDMVHPEYRILKAGQQPAVEEYLTPIYPLTEGISQMKVRQLVELALNILAVKPPPQELLPKQLIEQFNFPKLSDSLIFLHKPTPDTSLQTLQEGKHPATKRLAFEELLAYQLSMRRLRHQMREVKAPALLSQDTLKKRFFASLSFQLTGAQQRVIDEIHQDIIKNKPMMRLVQGDVGSGKTVVAAATVLSAIEAGYQVAIMAPTEILAEQHYLNFKEWFAPLEVAVGWLVSKQKAAMKREVQDLLATGKIDVVVGTHALFQQTVSFKRLGLVVIDEQHRFGVEQRKALLAKGQDDNMCPHQLVMTATPIPRTLAMIAYADLSQSVIDELPPGRTPIQTIAVPNTKRNDVIERIANVCQQGRQVYWVCTLIAESETLQCKAAEDVYQYLAEALPNLQIGLVHGRVKAEEKERIITQFKDGKIDLLVATTVIEVGVNVPNASLMVIDNPERLGLAQLHQLRGRVGRGTAESYCVLMYHSPLSEQAKARLDILRKTTDGFEIAKRDMQLRGPGEVLGIKQTGLANFKVADILRDQALFPDIQKTARYIETNMPDQVEPLVERWVGHNEQYAEV